MTTMIEPTAPALPPYRADQRVTQARVLRSEWTKLRSLPSTAWSLLTTVVLIVGFSALYSMVRVTRPPRQPADVASFDPTAISLSGVHLAQLAIGVLGALLITGEYATGMIRTSVAAVPRRLPVLWGKAIAFALTTLALCVPATFAAFLLGQSILSAERLDTTLGHPADRRGLPTGHLVGRDLQVPAHAGRRRRHQRAARPHLARTVDRVRPVLPLHRRRARACGLAATPPRRLIGLVAPPDYSKPGQIPAVATSYQPAS
jgi:hypothetical protein